MCELIRKYKGASFVGYKVVIDMNGYFFSPAMGCKYPLKGKVPVVTKQIRLADYFFSHILSGQSYRPKMKGRTAAFYKKSYALRISRLINNSYYVKSKKSTVVKVKLTKDLMEGTYGRASIVAGRHIEFLDYPESQPKEKKVIK